MTTYTITATQEQDGQPISANQAEALETAWWAWHDADSARWYADIADAESACAAWVAGESDVGPAEIRRGAVP